MTWKEGEGEEGRREGRGRETMEKFLDPQKNFLATPLAGILVCRPTALLSSASMDVFGI